MERQSNWRKDGVLQCHIESYQTLCVHWLFFAYMLVEYWQRRYLRVVKYSGNSVFGALQRPDLLFFCFDHVERKRKRRLRFSTSSLPLMRQGKRTSSCAIGFLERARLSHSWNFACQHVWGQALLYCFSNGFLHLGPYSKSEAKQSEAEWPESVERSRSEACQVWYFAWYWAEAVPIWPFWLPDFTSFETRLPDIWPIKHGAYPE